MCNVYTFRVHSIFYTIFLAVRDNTMQCVVDARTNRYLPKKLAAATDNYETDYFHYDHSVNSINCKLFTSNLYRSYFKQVYPTHINEEELTNDMLDVLKSYTDSRSSECYMKTNLNLLSGNVADIDWIYVNKLHSLIRGLNQSGIKHVYYRGLTLSDTEVQYYMDKRSDYYYTNSFSSFTIDRLLVYSGNAILILRTDNSSERAKKDLANIWKWSTISEEKEALLAVGARLKIVNVHYFGCKWEIEVELCEADSATGDDEQNTNLSNER